MDLYLNKTTFENPTLQCLLIFVRISMLWTIAHALFIFIYKIKLI